MTAEARDWDEYLAWTRGADPGQYEMTEERAWQRLLDARLRRRVTAFEIVPPPEESEADDGAPEWIDPPGAFGPSL